MTDTISQKWAVYESNVQQYRVLSATVQSFLLAVGSIWFSAQKPPPNFLLGALFLIGLAHIFVVWRPIVHARIKIVDYYKGQLDMSVERRAELAAFCTEDQYRESDDLRRQVVDRFFDPKLREPVRNTRTKLDNWVPWAYAVIWACMVLSKLVP